MQQLSHPAAVGISMQEYFDIIIIGAGPAGLNAGLHVLKGSVKHSILLVDKTAPWEHPIQCAEAVSRSGFERSINVRPNWIRQTITKAAFHAPNGLVVTYTDKNGGYIIDRAAMQQDIAHDLMAQGVVCHFDRRVTHVSSSMKNFHTTIEFADGLAAHGRVIIDAAGPIAGLGRDSIPAKPLDLEPACFVLADGLALSADTVHIYMSKEFAPGGYAWVFPRGAGANIGIIVGSALKGKVNISRLLDAFLLHHFPKVSIVKRYAGVIPCASGRTRMATSGFFKAGDAASTANPISRAGISEGLYCGGLAGDYAVAMLEAHHERDLQKVAKAYETAWHKNLGHYHEKLARVKSTFAKVPDEDYSKAADALSRLEPAKLTMFRIFKAALGRFPRLLWGLRHMV
jgi:digeranylgeranylglycerophospholipid reductase